MTQISVSDLKVNVGKYITMAQEQDIFITKNGKIVAKLVTAKPDKKAAWDSLQRLLQGVSLTDSEIDKLKEERIMGC